MKLFYIILLCCLLSVSASAQRTIFVLVDVSRSVTTPQLADARQALKEVLSGSALSKAALIPGSDPHDLDNFKLAPGDSLAIQKFGNLQTTLAINPIPVPVQNIDADVNQAINSISWYPSDGQTYLTLAKAKIAEYAKNNHISKYKLCIISDNVNDDYGPGGSPRYPNQYIIDLVQNYNSATNPVSEAGYAKIKFDPSSLFTLSFSPGVDVSTYKIPQNGGSTTTPVKTPPVAPASPAITLTSFADGKKDKPKPAASGSFTISWSCNCPVGTKFNIILTETGGTYKDKKTNIDANSVKFNDVPSGTFRVVVSAPNVSSATTYVEVPGGSSGIIFLILLVGGGVAAGYYFWNKKRQDKIESFQSGKNNNDIFSGGNQSGTNSGGGSSSNSGGYF